MHKKLWTLMLASCVAVSALAIACGDDDNGASSGTSGGVDGGNIDGSLTDGSLTDGGDAGCTFAGFVHTIIASPATGTPSTDLGAECTPSTSQADFADLFPAQH